MAFYTRLFSALPLTFARSKPLMAEFDRIQAGFTAVETGDLAANSAEIAAARQGQASLVLNLGRFLSIFAPAAGSADMGGNRIRNAADAALSTDYTTLQQVQAMAFSAALPAMAAQLGKVVRVNAGPAYACDNWWGAPVLLTVANNGSTLSVNTTYHLDSSGGAFSVLMPVMAVGDYIKLVDVAGQLQANNVTVVRNVANGNLAGYAEDRILDVSMDSLELVKTASFGVVEQ